MNNKNNNNNNNNRIYIKNEFKNKCFAKDLTISFGMGTYQKNKKLEAIERYERVLKSKNPDELNEFEKFQSKISSYLLYDENRLSFLFTTEELKRNLKNNSSSGYQFKPNNFYNAIELVKRDRSGLIKNEFLLSIINNGPEAQYLKSHPIYKSKVSPGNFDFQGFEQKKESWTTSFSKLKSDGSAVYKMITTLIKYDYSKLTINKELYFNYGNNEEEDDDIDDCIPHYKKQIINSSPGSNMHDQIVKRETNLTKETRSESIAAGLNQWGKILEFPFGCMVLPSFKEICFSVLREMFLISNKSVIDKLLTLPIPILQEFLNSCFRDDRPTGKEITFKLYTQLVKAQNQNQYLSFNLQELFPLDKMISSCFNRDAWFRYNYDHEIVQDLFYPPYSDKFAINVYENYHFFKSLEIPINLESNVLFQSTNVTPNNNNNRHSIVDKNKFISNFNIVTHDRFKDTSGIPKNCIFIGGILTYCLLDNGDGECKGFENSDIDICFYDCGYDEVKGFIEFYFPKEDDEDYYDYSVTQHGNHITISKHYPYRHIQLNLHSYLSLEHVLMGVDIEASCFAFDGNDLWCLERSIYSMNYRINIASEYSYMIRGDRNYQNRLLKYEKRGFSIFYHSTKKTDQILKSFNLDDGSFIPSINQIGFSLLLSARSDYLVYNKLVNLSSSSLPFGPKVKKNNFNKWVERNYSVLYDGYNEKSIVSFATDHFSGIPDLFSFERDCINYNRSSKWDRQLNESELQNFNYQFHTDVKYCFDGEDLNESDEIGVDTDDEN